MQKDRPKQWEKPQKSQFMMKNLQKESPIRPKVIQVNAWTVRNTLKVSIYDEKSTEEELDKTRSYRGELGQNT